MCCYNIPYGRRWEFLVLIYFFSHKHDDFHFVIQCKLYTEIIKLNIDNYDWQKPNCFKVVELIQSKNVRNNNILALYLNKAFKLIN